jgi:homoserine/homoserine lactone efflux protein
MELSTWAAFVVAGILISISPGAGAVACMATGMRHGLAMGWWNIFGMQWGIALQLAIVGAGLGALIATSAVAFTVVKFAGAAYLFWLGWQQFRAPAVPIELRQGETGRVTRRSLVLQGFLVNGTNPKATIFLLAVLPQFIDPSRPVWPQYLICAATLTVIDLPVMGAYTYLAARVLRHLRDPRQIRWLNRGFGAMFMVAGGLLAGFRRGA